MTDPGTIAAAAAHQAASVTSTAAAAEMAHADRIAGLVVDKLGQGFTIDRRAFRIISSTCQGRHRTRISWGGGPDEVFLVFTVIGDDRAEMALEINGPSMPIWQGTLRAAP